MLPVGHTHDFDDAGLFGHIQPRIKSVTTTGLFDVIAQLKSIWSPLCLLLVVTESDSLSLTEHCWQVQASKAGQRSTCTDDTRRSHLRLDQQTSPMEGRLIHSALFLRCSIQWKHNGCSPERSTDKLPFHCALATSNCGRPEVSPLLRTGCSRTWLHCTDIPTQLVSYSLAIPRTVVSVCGSRSTSQQPHSGTVRTELMGSPSISQQGESIS